MDFYPAVINNTAIQKFQADFENEINDQTVKILGALTGSALVLLIKRDYKHYNKLNNYALLLFGFVFTSLLIPILLATLSLFTIYKSIVFLLLKLIHKNKFKGFLSGPDTFWTIRDDSKNAITILMIINSKNSNFYEKLKQHLKQTIEENKQLEKLLYELDYFMGYSFLIKSKNMVEDSVKKLERNCNITTLKQTLHECSNKDLPRNGKGMWEILIGTIPMEWNHRSNNYPIIIRFNHCIGDGIALIKLLIFCFKENKTIKLPQKEKIDKVQELVKITIRCMQFVVVIFNLPSVMLASIFKKADKNILHGKRLTGKRIITWKTEENPKYVDVVKNIKKRYKSGFFEVVATALSASLKDFLSKNKESCENISVIVPAVPNSLQFKNINDINNKLELTNTFSVGILDMPINKKETKYLLQDRFRNVISRIFNLRTSYEYQVNFWLLEIVCDILPHNILRPMLDSKPHTMILSNLPGPKKLVLMDGNKLEDLIFWVPQRGLTGVGISLFTYDNRFQIGLAIDEVYRISESSAEIIFDGFFKYLSQLENESWLQRY